MTYLLIQKKDLPLGREGMLWPGSPFEMLPRKPELLDSRFY
jgi:hypothetical protein